MKAVMLMVAAAAVMLFPAVAHAWEPSQPIDIVVPAKAGGADELAREIAKVIGDNHMTSQPVNVVNKAGGSGAEAYMYVKGKSGDTQTLVITLSNLFTLPVAVGTPYKWSDMTPVARMALDDFILWVNAETPYKKAKDYLDAAKAESGKFKMGGTGAAQEDQIVTIMLEQASGAKFTYVPLSGGGAVAQALADKKLDSTVNNPAEAVKLWHGDKVRPLGVARAKRMSIEGWTSVPTLKEQGFDVQYQMMRGIFGPPDMPAEAKAYYTELLHKVSSSPEFKSYLKSNALKDAWLTGDNFHTWLSQQDDLHRRILISTGLKGS